MECIMLRLLPTDFLSIFARMSPPASLGTTSTGFTRDQGTRPVDVYVIAASTVSPQA
jgi:hypothetical protein